MEIKIKKGFDIPIIGASSIFQGELSFPSRIGCDLSPFIMSKLALKVKVGDFVKAGDPIAEDKECPGRFFVSPAAGKVIQVHRGLKRRLLLVEIETAKNQERKEFNQKELISLLMESGLMTEIFARPGFRLANPKKKPRSIFVNAVASAPFDPPFEMEIDCDPELFQEGLRALSQIAPVHLVMKKGTESNALKEAKEVSLHTIEGPHPIESVSLHIYHIDPIFDFDTTVWALSPLTVLSLGMLLKKGRLKTSRFLSLAGEGVLEEKRGVYKGFAGQPISDLIDPISDGIRVISGNPLTGQKIDAGGCLGIFARCFSLIPEKNNREPLHFFRFGSQKFTATATYLSHLLHKKLFSFTTNQHGEERAFIDPAIYDKAFSMKIPLVALMKALMAEDYERAIELGFLEVGVEDFSLPEFICPSKIPMTEIVKKSFIEFQRAYLP